MNMKPGGQLAERARKESKRLLRIAHENGGVLKIEKLAEAQAIVARLKGRANWNDLISGSGIETENGKL